MKLNRTLVLCLSIVLAASMALGGTLAFLTDTEQAVNEFTVGDVDIELIEMQRDEEGNLSEFEQGQQLMPGQNVSKETYIKNVGGNTAWVWLTYGVPSKMDNPDDPENRMLHVYNNAAERWENPGEPIGTSNVGGVDYNIYIMRWPEPLVPGAQTDAGLDYVHMDNRIDYDPITGMYYLISGGEQIGEGVTAAELQNTKIIVNAYAFQYEGFENASIEEVVNTYQEQWGQLTDVIEKTDDAVTVTEVFNEAELVEAVNAGGRIKLMDSFNLTKQLTIPEGVVVTLDMNEQVLGTAETAWGIVIKGNLTIYGDDTSVLDFRSTSGMSTSAVGNGVLTIKGGKYQHSGDYMIGCYNGSVTITDGVFDGDYCCVCNFDSDNDGNKYYGSVVINGGTFSVKDQSDPQYPSSYFYGNVIDNRIP